MVGFNSSLVPHRGTLAHQLLEELVGSDEERPCSQDPELWWSINANEIKTAKSYCRACPLQQLCGAYAIEARESGGVWGGMDTNERHLMRRRRQKAEKRRAERAARFASEAAAPIAKAA